MRFRYAQRRLAGSVVAVFLSSVVVFAVFFVLPGGDPAVRIAGRTATPETIVAVRVSYGFNRPLYDQYLTMMGKLFTNRLESYVTHADVVSQVLSRIGPTFSVAVGATVLGGTLTVISATIGAAYRGRVPAAVVSGLSMVLVSMPAIYLMTVLQYGLGERSNLLPVGGYVSFAQSPWGWFQHLILPWTVLSLGIFAVSGRLLTANMIDTLGQPYVKTAHAKGASSARIWFGHVLPNAVLPVVTTLGLEFAGLLGGGAILVETVFDIPGDGQYASEAVQTLDIPVLIGLSLVGSIIVIVVNALVDLLYPLIDPRARAAS